MTASLGCEGDRVRPAAPALGEHNPTLKSRDRCYLAVFFFGVAVFFGVPQRDPHFAMVSLRSSEVKGRPNPTSGVAWKQHPSTHPCRAPRDRTSAGLDEEARRWSSCRRRETSEPEGHHGRVVGRFGAAAEGPNRGLHRGEQGLGADIRPPEENLFEHVSPEHFAGFVVHVHHPVGVEEQDVAIAKRDGLLLPGPARE